MSVVSRKILVTGATSGIGAGIARAFSVLGDSVTITGATEAEAKRAADDPTFAGIACHVLDVRDGTAVAAFVEGLGELDAVVNCAGVIRRGAEHDPVAFADVIDINLTGAMRVCSAARAGLKARRGCIVNTASMLSFFGGGLVPGYSASKGGVAQLTKSLAVAYAADGIRVNAVRRAGLPRRSRRRCRTTRRGQRPFLRARRWAAGARRRMWRGRCCSCAVLRPNSSPAWCCRWTGVT